MLEGFFALLFDSAVEEGLVELEKPGTLWYLCVPYSSIRRSLLGATACAHRRPLHTYVGMDMCMSCGEHPCLFAHIWYG